jgi:hypothetical protein
MEERRRKAQVNSMNRLRDDALSNPNEGLEGAPGDDRADRRKRVTRGDVHKLRGSLKGKGLLKALVAEKKKEREL